MKVYSYIYSSKIIIYVLRDNDFEELHNLDFRKDQSKDPKKVIRLVKYDEENEYYDLKIVSAIAYNKRVKKAIKQGFF